VGMLHVMASRNTKRGVAMAWCARAERKRFNTLPRMCVNLKICAGAIARHARVHFTCAKMMGAKRASPACSSRLAQPEHSIAGRPRRRLRAGRRQLEEYCVAAAWQERLVASDGGCALRLGGARAGPGTGWFGAARRGCVASYLMRAALSGREVRSSSWRPAGRRGACCRTAGLP
jgi:hypothetical protein